MVDIEQILRRYLETPSTNYAIQLNGEWGIGKTHFIKTDIKKFIEEEMQYKFCYVSLNGINSIDEIKRELFFELSSSTSTITDKGLGMLKFISDCASVVVDTEYTSTVLKEYRDSFQKIKPETLYRTFICFDDLERIGDSLPIDELLGFLNSGLIEHNHIKVLIVTNEERVKEENFKEIKEKIIGPTIQYKCKSMKEILDSILMNYVHNVNITRWQLEESEKVTEVLENLQITNLRTLKYTVGLFYNLLEELKDWINGLQINEKDYVHKILFLNLIVCANEIRTGRLSKKITMSGFNHWKSNLLIRYVENAPPEEYTTPFIERYHKKNNYYDETMHYYDFILEFALTGAFDKAEATQLLENQFRTEIPSDQSEEKNNDFYSLADYLYYEEDELEKMISRVLEQLPTLELKIGEYFELYLLLEKIESEFSLEIKNNWQQIINSVFKEKLPTFDFNIRGSRFSFDKTGNALFDEMIDLYTNSLQTFTELSAKDKIINWLENMKEEELDREFVINVRSEDNLFLLLNEVDIANNYFLISNKVTRRLIEYLKETYLNVINKAEYNSHEVPEIKRMIEHVKTLQMKPGSIKEKNIKDLLSLLNEIVEHLQK
ncbi:P-loop NTPase fold protein [Lysinibacillus varians]|uniref:P-loop NTPase fold protein n=1 Tax=Lysinibacillus varians TaxID=1145276 RepID=UPI00042F1F2F|nr:P-loop NTPase fold protein [Lysinibacillus varians]AHN24270.1 hypothetical protein T479_12690 [Lysinibacillus varians]